MMTRRHSLVTRALALVMALVLIASNGAGLTLGAKAAVTGNLFDLMSKHGATNETVDAVLAYADYMPELKAMNVSVTYDEEPTAAVGTLRQGTLTVEEIGNWLPCYYQSGNNEPVYFNGDYVVEGLGEDITSVNVVYTQMPADEADVQAVQMWVHELASIPAAQAAALGTLSTGNKLTALKVLEYEFISGLSADVDAIKASDLGIELTAEDLGITNETVLQEMGYTQEEIDLILANGIDEETQAKIDAEVQKKINEEVAKELETVKAEFKGVIEKLLLRLVDENDPYSEILNDRGRSKYLDYLRIYAMMNEYDLNGLPFYYENSDEIVTEMEALAAVLDEILGEENEDGINYNQMAMQHLLDAGEYGVEVPQIESLKNQMVEGAATLRAQEDNLKTVTDKIDMENCSDLKGLLDALAAYDLTGCMMQIFMYSKQLSIVDDSWKYITTTVNGTPVNIKCATDAVLTEADIEAAVEQIEAAAPHYDVDTTAVKALVGTKMTANVIVECPAVAKTYEVEIEGVEDPVEVTGDKATITLPFVEGHSYEYVVNGETIVVKSAKDAVIEVDLDQVASGELVIVQAVDNNENATWLLNTRDTLNDSHGDNAVVVADDQITVNSTDAMMDLFMEIYMDQGQEAKLNGQPFLYNNEGSPTISGAALVNALLSDPTFTSDKLITGEGSLLNASLSFGNYVEGENKEGSLSLTLNAAVPEAVSEGLKAIEGYMTFNAVQVQTYGLEPQQNYLNIDLKLPEKVYEAYLTAAILSGRVSNDDAAALNNEVALNFVNDYFNLLMTSDVDVDTIENTLNAMGVQKDLSGYADYYDMVKNFVNAGGISERTIEEDQVYFQITGTQGNVYTLLNMLGIDLEDPNMGGGVVEVEDKDIVVDTLINMSNNPAPKFDALVIDPARLNDAGYKAKIMAVNYTTNLTTADLQGAAAIMLLGDVNGDLVFDHTTILDLNGFTVNGSITANAPLYIVDSSMDTVSGATVTGAVTGNVTVLAGTYPTANVSAFIKDGYYMDGSNVMNAMYEITDGKIVVDGDLYLENVDGYLPAVHYMAADIAIDMALNYYFAAGFEADGNGIYAIEFNDLVAMLENKDIGDVADQALACFDAAGTSAFINAVIADLLDFGAVADAVENNTSLGAYTFNVYPWSVAVRHETAGDYVTVDVLPSTEAKSYTLDLTVAIPESGAKDKLVKALKVLDNRVTESKVEVTIDQPKRDGKNLLVGGSGTAAFTLDFSDDQKYNEMLAGVIAYFNEEVESVLVDEKMCIINLNNAMSKVTVGQFFTAVEGVIENPEITFADIAAKLEVELTEAQLAKMEELYADFKIVCTKVINKFNLTTNSTAPLSELADGNGAFVVNGDIQAHTADAYLKGFGLIANLGYSDVTLTVQLAPKCTEILGDANWDGDVNILDVIVLNRYVVKLITADKIHMCVCDLNGDGDVNVLDLILLNRYVVKEISKFPVE